MYNEAIVINNKYCLVKANNQCFLLQKSNDRIDFESILRLENHLEEEKLRLDRISQELENLKINKHLHIFLSIGGLILSGVIIKFSKVKEPIFAPLTITSLTTIGIFKQMLTKYQLEKTLPIVREVVCNIQSNLKCLKDKAGLENQELLMSLNDSMNNQYGELHMVLESLFSNEEIKEEKHLILTR